MANECPDCHSIDRPRLGDCLDLLLSYIFFIPRCIPSGAVCYKISSFPHPCILLACVHAHAVAVVTYLEPSSGLEHLICVSAVEEDITPVVLVHTSLCNNGRALDGSGQ
jgi:hypothetical protein